MGLLQSFIKNLGKDKKEFKRKFKETQEERRINELVEERSKSSNERELEKIMEKKRQDMILEKLKQIRKKETSDMWKSNSFGGKATILNEGRPILKEKNIFHGNQNLFSKKSLFFS